MKRTALALTLVMALSLLVIAEALFVKPVNARTVTVPDDYSTIQSAIDAANDGDTVFVKSGYYPETLDINKSLTIIGQDREHTIIDAQKKQTRVVYISHGYVTFTNFTLGNTGKAAFSGSGGGISGIYFSGTADNNTIINNTIIDVCGDAFRVSSHNNTIKNNILINCWWFLTVWGVNNTIVDNLYSPDSGGIVSYPTANVIEGNMEVNFTDVPSPFPFPSPKPSPTPTSTPKPIITPTITPYQETQQTEQQEVILGVAVTIAIVGAGLGLLLYLIKRK